MREMSENERLEKYINGEVVDCIPYGLIDLDYVIGEIAGYKTSEINNDIDVYADVIRIKKEDYGFGGMSLGLGDNLKILGEALGSELYYPEHGYEYVSKFILEIYDDMDKIENVNLRSNKVLREMIAKGHKLKEKFPDPPIETSVAGAITSAASIRPVEKLLKDSRKAPDKLKHLLSIITDYNLEWIRMFKDEFGVAAVAIADPVSSQDIISETQYLEFIHTDFKRLVDGINEIMGEAPMVHICGHTSKFWKYYRELNISAFSVDNCEDIGQTVKALGNHCMVIGNVDPVSIIRNGSKEDIYKACRDSILKGAECPSGFMLYSGCEIPLGTPKENLLTFIDAAKTFGRNAKWGELPEGVMECSKQI